MQSTAQKWVSPRRDSHCDFNYCCASLAEPRDFSTLIICRPPSFTDSHRDKPYSKKDTWRLRCQQKKPSKLYVFIEVGT